jgi:YVTN family beta-propeller protein
MVSRVIRAVLLAALGCASATAAFAQEVEVYVANYGDGDVSVLDATTLAELARIPVNAAADPQIPVTGDPSALALSLNRKRALVVLSNGRHVAVINTTMRKVIEYVEIPPVTVDALIFRHPFVDRFYVTSCTDPVVSVIDLDSHGARMTGQIALPTGSYPMAFSSSGLVGYIGNGYGGLHPCGSANGIYRVNLLTNKTIGFIPTSLPVSDVAVAPTGRFALATGADRIVVVDLTTNSEMRAVTCGLAPCTYGFSGGIVFNGAGTRAYAVDYFDNTLSTIDTNPDSPQFLRELSRVPVITSGERAWQVVVHKDRAVVVVIGYPGEAISFDISTDVPMPIEATPVGDFAYELDVWTVPSRKHR